ncbi:hypothetical protein TherJR_0674 [Thermincola potens JR]|uniref:DUF4083 domain-containing protein n=1 Tax=Thermincola potens (strain JR) TaxID=635013 RepID=D5XBZ6_THEPJ|nr:hypothetical protein TherJR_0674 [Thermincola potens JR]
MGFDALKFLWQIVNFLILIGIFVLIFVIPARVFKKINVIESHLEQINRRLETLEENKVKNKL